VFITSKILTCTLFCFDVCNLPTLSAVMNVVQQAKKRMARKVVTEFVAVVLKNKKRKIILFVYFERASQGCFPCV